MKEKKRSNAITQTAMTTTTFRSALNSLEAEGQTVVDNAFNQTTNPRGSKLAALLQH